MEQVVVGEFRSRQAGKGFRFPGIFHGEEDFLEPLVRSFRERSCHFFHPSRSWRPAAHFIEAAVTLPGL
jgi:hypothetical protein